MHDDDARPPGTFTVAGINVRITLWGLALGALIGFQLFGRYSNDPDRSTQGAATIAIVGAVLFVASILAHEFGHAIEARSRRMRVSGITLFLLGGVTEMHGEPDRPRDEFAIAAVGPFVSLLAAAVLGTMVQVIRNLGWESLTWLADIGGVVAWLNVVIAIFNLLPAAPLDGGRILRALIWAVTGSRHRGIIGAAWAGRGFALLLAFLGLRLAMTDGGGSISIIWYAMLAMFTWQAASAELRHARSRQVFDDLRVTDLVRPPVPTIGDWPAAQALQYVDPATPDEAPLVVARQEGDQWLPTAVVLAGALRSLSPHDAPFRTTTDLGTALDDLPRVAPDATVTDLLILLDQHPVVLFDDGVFTVWTRGGVTTALRAGRPESQAPQPVGTR